jgi:transketolase C-terminal domain/subunit
MHLKVNFLRQVIKMKQINPIEIQLMSKEKESTLLVELEKHTVKVISFRIFTSASQKRT